MTEIEHLIEGINIVIPDYSGRKFTDDEIERGVHRDFVVGLGATWDEDGRNQVEYLKSHGLRPHHKVIDIGCGALRAGRHFVEYLEPRNYYGVDANLDLICIGYDVEFTDEQRSRLPVGNLRANDRFNVDFGVQFDYAIAQSVFTHVSFNHMRLCLYRLSKALAPGGKFLASYFEQPPGTPPDHMFQKHPKGRTYFYEKNIYWYLRSDMEWAAKGFPWRFEYAGDYGSKQGQVMGMYERTPDERPAPRRLLQEARRMSVAVERRAHRAVRAVRRRGSG